MASFRRASTSSGMPSGATMPRHAAAPQSGPPDSTNVGTSANASMRSFDITAKALTRPASIKPEASTTEDVTTSTPPATSSCNAAAEPLDVDTIESKISKKSNVAKSLEKLQLEYSNRGINLVCIKDKWSFRTSPKLSGLMSQEKTVEKKLSRAAVETLAIIVYHQPVTRAEIEEIRGVAFGTNTLEILMELDWVKPAGRKDVPGRPIQYATTDEFLSHFNLQKLSDLPTVDELGAAGLIDSSSVDNAIFGTGKFFKEKQDEKKEDIYSNIDEMLNSTLDSEEKD